MNTPAAVIVHLKKAVMVVSHVPAARRILSSLSLLSSFIKIWDWDLYNQVIGLSVA